VGEQLPASLQIFLHDPAIDCFRVDFEDDQIAPPTEEPVRHSPQLVRVRTVDEPLPVKRRRLVDAGLSSSVNLEPGRDVIEASHSGLLIEHKKHSPDDEQNPCEAAWVVQDLNVFLIHHRHEIME
jgi:hypothetical protein